MVSELGRVLNSGLFELPIDFQDMALVGEDRGVLTSLLIEDQGAGESRFGWLGEITSNSLVSDQNVRPD